MEAGTTVYPYHCLQCGATGELPLVVGDTSCPRCAEHLWTVRGEVSQLSASGAPPRLRPERQLPIQNGRPPLDTGGLWSVRLRVALFRPIVVLWMMLRQRIRESRVHEKLEQVSRCRGRAELEQLIGKPLYAVNPEACGKQGVADLIECYESDGCCIDLWFKNDDLVDVSGFVKPTLWDIAMAGSSEPVAQDSQSQP